MEEEIKNYIDYLTFERRNAKNTYNSYKSDLEEYRLYLKQKNILDVKDILSTVIFYTKPVKNIFAVSKYCHQLCVLFCPVNVIWLNLIRKQKEHNLSTIVEKLFF
jgi:hypothetical protein